jgi:hypothetical protein
MSAKPEAVPEVVGLCLLCGNWMKPPMPPFQPVVHFVQSDLCGMCRLFQLAERVIEAARHRIDCPHYHSFPTDNVSGICCRTEETFRMSLLEWDRARTKAFGPFPMFNR